MSRKSDMALGFLVWVLVIGLLVGGVWWFGDANIWGTEAHERGRQFREAIISQGYQACEAGIPAEACHYSAAKNEDGKRLLWMQGWQQYRQEHPIKSQ